MAHYEMEEAKESGKRSAKIEGLRRKGYSEKDAVLISMKKDKNDKDEIPSTAPSSMSEESYPYGLRIRLENDELEKLGMDELPEIGKVCKLEAEGVVQSASASQSKGDESPRKSVEIQLTKMNLHKARNSDKEEKSSDKENY